MVRYNLSLKTLKYNNKKKCQVFLCCIFEHVSKPNMYTPCFSFHGVILTARLSKIQTFRNVGNNYACTYKVIILMYPSQKMVF